MQNFNYVPYSDDMMKEIIRIFAKHGEKVGGYLDYNGRAIRVSGRYGTNFWIRVDYWQNGLLVDLSSVNIRKSLRRQGIFTEICETLANKEYTERIMITNPSTTEMHNFGKKHNLRFDSSQNRYIVKE